MNLEEQGSGHVHAYKIRAAEGSGEQDAGADALVTAPGPVT